MMGMWECGNAPGPPSTSFEVHWVSIAGLNEH